jgi:hypothetical protein
LPRTDRIYRHLYGITNSGAQLSITKSEFYGGNGQGINTGFADTINKATGMGGSGIRNSGANLSLYQTTIAAGSGGTIIIISDTSAIVGSGDAAQAGAGGHGIDNTIDGTNLHITECSITAGTSGSISLTANNGLARAGFSTNGLAKIDIGGTGITNAGAHLQVTACAISAGASGDLTVYTTTIVQIGANSGGNVSIGGGGSGIASSAADTRITHCTIQADPNGKVTVTNASYIELGAFGTVLINDGGDAMATFTGASGVISDCIITSSNNSSISVSEADTKTGSANGGNSGNGILCNGSNNFVIQNSIINGTGQSGNGYRGTHNTNAIYPGSGGNGGNGILITANTSHIEVRNNTITNTGFGGRPWC